MFSCFKVSESLETLETLKSQPSLPLQQIHRLAHIMYPEIFRQRRIFLLHFLEHRIGDIAIGEMASRPSAQL